MVTLIWLVFLGCACWVAYDSSQLRSRRGRVPLDGLANTSPVAWFFVCALIWIVGFPVYLMIRPTLVRAAENPPQAGGPMGVSLQYAHTVLPQAASAPLAVPEPVYAGVAAGPAGVPAGAAISPDGYWWWDGGTWQPVPR